MPNMPSRKPTKIDVDQLLHAGPWLTREEAIELLLRQWRREELVRIKGQLRANVDVRHCLVDLIDCLLISERRSYELFRPFRAIGISSHHCLYNCGIQLALPGLS